MRPGIGRFARQSTQTGTGVRELFVRRNRAGQRADLGRPLAGISCRNPKIPGGVAVGDLAHNGNAAVGRSRAERKRKMLMMGWQSGWEWNHVLGKICPPTLAAMMPDDTAMTAARRQPSAHHTGPGRMPEMRWWLVVWGSCGIHRQDRRGPECRRRY